MSDNLSVLFESADQMLLISFAFAATFVIVEVDRGGG